MNPAPPVTSMDISAIPPTTLASLEHPDAMNSLDLWSDRSTTASMLRYSNSPNRP